MKGYLEPFRFFGGASGVKNTNAPILQSPFLCMDKVTVGGTVLKSVLIGFKA